MISIAASTSLAFRSFIFASAISRSCASVTEPATALPGVLDADCSPAAFFRRKDAGGVLISIGEGLVGEVGDDHRGRLADLHLLRAGVERLAELHDVDAALTQRRPDGRRGVRLAGGRPAASAAPQPSWP